MAASATDKFKKLTNNFSTTLSSPIGAGDATITPAAVTNLPTDTGTVFVIDRVDASGNKTAAKREYIKGTISGGNIINAVRGLGNSTALSHSTGAVVEQVMDTTTWNDTVDGLLVGHNLDGTHITSLPLTTPKITTGINDANGVQAIGITATASAVNGITVTNSATTVDPRISATGTDATANLNLRGKGLAKTVTIGAGAIPIYPFDFVYSGCVWTADSVGVNLNASGTAGVVVINGNPLTVAADTARAMTLNVDTYIDVLDNGDGTGLYVRTTAATNAASPALASNSIRICIIQAAATITATTKVNQGQEESIFPIASSTPYAVTDSLGNLICPRDPQRRLLGYRRYVSVDTGIGASTVDLTGLSVPFIADGLRKVKVTLMIPQAYSTVDTDRVDSFIFEGATKINQFFARAGLSSTGFSPVVERILTPTAGLHTYKGSLARGAGTGTVSTYADGVIAWGHLRIERL